MAVFQGVSTASTVHTRSPEKSELGKKLDENLEETQANGHPLGPVTELAFANMFPGMSAPKSVSLLPDVLSFVSLLATRCGRAFAHGALTLSHSLG